MRFNDLFDTIRPICSIMGQAKLRVHAKYVHRCVRPVGNLSSPRTTNTLRCRRFECDVQHARAGTCLGAERELSGEPEQRRSSLREKSDDLGSEF
jgi:hypothetical protein